MDYNWLNKYANPLQLLGLILIFDFMRMYKVKKYSDFYDTIELVRGENRGKESLEVKIKFSIEKYEFEFLLYENQLEYYIEENGSVVADCNLEDYGDFDDMIINFKSYLLEDCNKLAIHSKL